MYNHMIAKRQINEMKEKYKVLSIANFLENVSNFFQEILQN